MSQYVFVKTKDPITWTSASAAALLTGGNLASVNSAEEDTFVKSVLNRYQELWTQEPRQDALNGPWIGLFQPQGSDEPRGGWTWADGSDISFNGWHPTQPDNFRGDAYGHYWTYQGQVGWGDHVNNPESEGYGPIQSYIVEYGDELAEIQGGKSNDIMFGGDIANSLFGNGGNDTISGGGGADSLSGGKGKDRFVFDDASDANGDQILDLEAVDKVDFSQIDANLGRDGNQGFRMVEAFTGKAGQMTLGFFGGVTSLSGDVNGDGLADFVVSIVGDHTLFAGYLL